MVRWLTIVAILVSGVACSSKEDVIPCDAMTPCPEGYTCDLNLGQCVEGTATDVEPADDEGTGDTGGTGDEGTPVEDDTFIVDDHGGTDGDTFCTPNAFIRCVDETKEVRCSADGSTEEVRDCNVGFRCIESHGGCQYQFCEPGKPVCDPQMDPAAVYECDENGLGHLTEPIELCDTLTGEICVAGQCMTQCEMKAYEKSYEGCDYFTANLRNLLEQRTDPIFAITISNTNETATVTVDITVSDDGTTEVDAGTNHFCLDNASNCQTMTSAKGLTIGPKKLGIVIFPHDRMITGSGNFYKAYHIVTDMPVTVYQFNPFDNSTWNPFNPDGLSIDVSNPDPNLPKAGKMYSNDASLLMPTSGVYTDYLVVSYHALGDLAPSYATVIGFRETPVEIEVNAPVALTGDFGGGVSSIPANVWTTLTLHRFQVIQLEAPTNGNDKGPDITGTRIRCKNPDSDTCGPFIVFGGHVCANVPAERRYCDHLEHQMLPVQTWGKNYLLVKFQPRGQEFDMVRIVASEDGTNITYTPFVPGPLPPFTNWNASTLLNAQQWTEFYINQPLFIQSDKPIMVVQYLTGSEMISATCLNSHPESCVGDPAMTVIPPIEQYRTSYIFLTPGSYVKNYATIVAPQGTEATLNGSPVTTFASIGGTGFQFTIVELGNQFQRHELSCTGSCGLYVYGWEQDVSYAYPGGLDLKDISQE